MTDRRVRAMTGRWSVESVREATGVPSCPKHEEPLRDRPVLLDGIAYGNLEWYCESCEKGKSPVVKVGTAPVTAKLIQQICRSCGEPFCAVTIRPYCGRSPCHYVRRHDYGHRTGDRSA